jgi:hypothetical protein
MRYAIALALLLGFGVCEVSSAKAGWLFWHRHRCPPSDPSAACWPNTHAGQGFRGPHDQAGMPAQGFGAPPFTPRPPGGSFPAWRSPRDFFMYNP